MVEGRWARRRMMMRGMVRRRRGRGGLHTCWMTCPIAHQGTPIKSESASYSCYSCAGCTQSVSCGLFCLHWGRRCKPRPTKHHNHIFFARQNRCTFYECRTFTAPCCPILTTHLLSTRISIIAALFSSNAGPLLIQLHGTLSREVFRHSRYL